MSRSELYARAVQRYVTECRHTGVKEKLDEVYAFEAESVDPAVLNAQAACIPARNGDATWGYLVGLTSTADRF
jgi:hypothetical protein